MAIRLVTRDHVTKLRWTDQTGDTLHGLGVLLYSKSNRILDGVSFAELVADGAYLLVSTRLEGRRAACALGLPMLNLPADAIRYEDEAY